MPNTPNLRKDNVFAVPGALNRQFLQITQGGRLLPYYKETIMVKYANSMSTFFEQFMTTDDVTKIEVNHVEQNPRCYIMKTGAETTATGPGESVWLPINASSMYFSGTYSLPQKGFVIQLPPDGKNAVVIDTDRTANAHRILVRPADPNYTIDVAASSDCVVVPASYTASGACDVYDSNARQPGVVYTNTLQTVRRDLTVDGEELVEFVNDCELYPLLDDNGQSHTFLWHHSLTEMIDEFELAKHYTMMTGEQLTNSGFTNKRGTTGFMWALRARGGYHGFSTDFDKTEWQAITRKMIAERNYCRQYAFWQGFALNQATEAILAEESAGKLSWGAFGGDSDKWMNYGFTGFKLDGIEFYLNTDRNFSDPCYLGNGSFSYNDLGVLVPLEQIQTKRGTHSHIVMNYLAAEGVSRRFHMWDRGLLRSGSYQGDCDHHRWTALSTFGAEFWAMNAFYLVEKL